MSQRGKDTANYTFVKSTKKLPKCKKYDDSYYKLELKHNGIKKLTLGGDLEIRMT